MAKWKPFDLTWGRSIYYCTECKEGIEVPTSCGKPMYKFCPMCGARMDTADTPQTETQMKTQNSNLTFEKDECAKEYEELGLKELKELIKADRKTENSSVFPNNCEECKHWNDTEDDCADRHGCRATTEDCSMVEPQTELVRVKYHCINCAENGSYKCSKCDGEMYYKYDKDEPQTERSE